MKDKYPEDSSEVGKFGKVTNNSLDDHLLVSLQDQT